MLKFNGGGPRPKADPPKPKLKWYPVLMTHTSGNQTYKNGSLRGIASKSEAESLIKRGLIDKTPVELPSDAVALKTNPTEAMSLEASKADKARNVLNEAAKTAWKPGMKVPPRAEQPAHGLTPESREEALHEVDRAVDSEMVSETPEGEPVPPADLGSKKAGKR